MILRLIIVIQTKTNTNQYYNYAINVLKHRYYISLRSNYVQIIKSYQFE